MSALALSNFCFADALVRARLDENDTPWFVAKDVCAALGIANQWDAVGALDDDEKITLANPEGNPRAGIPLTLNFISESGLYALIFRSRKPEARAFRKWVTAEVLPALRKKGGYGSIAVHADRHAPAAPLPEFVVPDCAAHLRSATRLKILWSAVRAADMENSGGEGIARYFEAFCKLVAQAPTSEEAMLESFADDCLVEQDGARTRASAIRDALRCWWKAHGSGRLPGERSLAAVLLARFERKHSNGIWYLNCVIHRQWVQEARHA